ncbi:MAG: extracellular solute-binding protein [Anaerolineae bacterium]
MSKRDLISRRQFIVAAGIGASAIALAACTPQATPEPAAPEVEEVVAAETPQASEPKGEFVFWTPPMETYEQIAIDFNAADTGVTAKWEGGEWDSNTKTMAALAAGTPPDASILGRWQSADLAVRNALVVLDDYIAGAQSWKWENIWERLQKDSMLWGKKWIVPWSTDTRALFYNKDIFEANGMDPDAPPKSWEELQEMAVKLTKRDSSGRLDQLGFSPSFSNPPVYLMFCSVLWCREGEMVDEAMTKITIASDAGIEAMTFLKQLMDAQGGYEEAVAFTSGLSLGEGIDAFSAGKVPICMNGSWTLPGYQKYSPDMNFGTVPGPYFEEYKIPANYDGGGGIFYFKKGRSNNFDAAWAFTEWAMTKEYQVKWADAVGAIPSRSDAGEEYAAANEEARRVFVSTANTVKWIPIFAGTLESLGAMATMFDNVLIGGNDIAEELTIAQDKMQQLLDRHNSFGVPS